MNQVAFIKTGDGNITLILNAKNYSIGTSHPNYNQIVEALKGRDYDRLENLIDIPAAITQNMGVQTGGNVVVRNGQVFYRDMPMHNTVTERILDFIREGLPYEPLVRFLENLMANPMPIAVAELFDFLENTSSGRKQFPITDDGCFIGYKGIRNDWMDCHTGTIDNSIGKRPNMDRSKVDPDRRNECSQGLHVGTIDYAKGFGQRTVLVKVNPKDCIAVPKDHNCSKLRVCEYEVIAEAPKESIQTPMYPMPEASPQVVSYEEAYQQGKAEFNNGRDQCTNPYDDETEAWNGWYEGWEDAADGYAQDEHDEIVVTLLSEDEIEREETNTITYGDKMITKTVRTVKRPACSYCGAKGGKRHATNCKRPRKS